MIAGPPALYDVLRVQPPVVDMSGAQRGYLLPQRGEGPSVQGARLGLGEQRPFDGANDE